MMALPSKLLIATLIAFIGLCTAANATEEFKKLREDWQYFRQQITDEKLDISIDCAVINLDDIELKNA